MIIKFVDLFAGVGGFNYGISKAQEVFGKCVYSNEWDKYANSVYRRHFKECDDRDIRTVTTRDIPDHDLLLGGFPCQSFSIAGKRRGFNDTRGTLFYEIARIVADKRPSYILLENVKGLLSHGGGRTFQTILGVLSDLGYGIQWQVLNSKNFGVPQNRERIFIVGHLGGVPRPQVFPLAGSNGQNHAVGHDEQPGPQKFIKTRHLSQNGTLLSESITLQATEIPHIIDVKRIKSPEARGLIKKGYTGALETGQQPVVIDTSYPSRARIYQDIAPTIRDFGSGGNKMPMVNGIRRLTPIECERLQGFPDDWTKYGSDGEVISDSQRYKMMGNAVTANVVTAIINKMFTTEPAHDRE
jgi:DNA (cytosine-5)-methyltransferase 1